MRWRAGAGTVGVKGAHEGGKGGARDDWEIRRGRLRGRNGEEKKRMTLN